MYSVAFGAACGLTDEQLMATAIGTTEDPAFTEADRLLVRLADELHDTATVTQELFSGWPSGTPMTSCSS